MQTVHVAHLGFLSGISSGITSAIALGDGGSSSAERRRKLRATTDASFLSRRNLGEGG